MKRVLLVLACFCFSAVSISAQTSRSTRPRIVPENPTTAQPPTIKNDSPKTQDKKTPPTLTRDYRDLPPPPPLPQEPIEDDEEIVINTNLVTFPVSVLDRNGRFISGLQQKDFKIFENGVEQKIEIFNSVEQPFTVVLLLDMSNSTQFQINEIQDAAITFVNQLRRDDKVMVVSFDERVHVLSRPTNNRAVLRDAILRTDFGGGTSLYDAVHTVINQHLRNIEGRKAIVLFTDGVDTTSRRADYLSTVREAEEVDALIYPLRYDTFRDMNPGASSGGGIYSPRRRRGGDVIDDILTDIFSGRIRRGGGGGGGRPGSGTSRAEYETGRRYLEDLAKNSGGRTYEATNAYNLDTAFAAIAEELRRQYSIGYYPDNVGQPGERRQIRVRVMRPNVVVRAKTSYIVGQNTARVAEK
jgi:Ca-activated chloride channel family protein